jgi:integrase
MPRRAKELKAIEVQRLKDPGLHFVGTVPGLALQISNTGARSWILRLAVVGRRREMGLGNYPEVPLAKAHEKAREARDLLKRGIDPIEHGRAQQSALAAAAALAVDFDHCAEQYIKAHSAGWKNAKHAQQVENTLKQYASPVMGKLLVRDVQLAHVLKVLEPIWKTKTETASRVRGRIETVLDWATTRGYREGPNPARWRGHLDNLLPKPGKVARVKHHKALPISDMGAFMARLRQCEGMGALALEFTILTAARSGEVRGATAGEIDRNAKVWTIPGARMKGGREHRVPLTDEALAVIDKADALHRTVESDLLFPAPRGGPLSDMTLTAVLRRLEVQAVPHGFRSTFKDWAAERTSYTNEMSEMALAHAIGDKTEAAYRRGDMFEKRRHMMADWAKFLSAPEVPAEVIPINKNRAGR